MDIEQYYQFCDGMVSFTRQQASDFARNVAGDFNPIHDVDAKRFCVPGDLLFAVVLFRYGLSRHMRFRFSGMVSDGVGLLMPPTDAAQVTVSDAAGRDYLHFEREGASTLDRNVIERLVEGYVAYSGHTFPHILVPLMASSQVMINPDRPTVMYESMSFHLDRLDIADPVLVPSADETRLDVNGKRGRVVLAFTFQDAGITVGRGEKHIVLSGLREFDPAVMSGIQAYYDQRRELHAAAG